MTNLLGDFLSVSDLLQEINKKINADIAEGSKPVSVMVITDDRGRKSNSGAQVYRRVWKSL